MTEFTRKDQDVLRELASDLIKAKQWQKARLVMQQLVTITPEDPSAHATLGLAWLRLNEFKEAEQCFRRALNEGGESVQILLFMARIYAYQGDFGGQLEWARRAANCDEEDPEPNFEIADANICLGRLLEAERVLKNVTENHPENIQAHSMLGQIYLSLQRIDESVQSFRTALSYDFSDAPLWSNLGHVLSRQNRYEDALAAFQNALYLEPDDFNYNYNVGDIYLALDQPKKALGFLTKSVQGNPSFSAGHYDLSLAFFKLGRYEECATASAAALRDDPDMATQRSNLGMGATTNLGLAFKNLGKYKEAEECFRRNLKLLASTYFNLGLMLFRQRRFQESLVNFQHALEIEPGDPEYLDLLGNSYSELGRLDEALKALNDAIAADDTYALAHYDIGTVLARMKGKEGAAVRSFRRAITLDADLYWAYYGIGCVYAQQGKIKLALRFLDKAFQKGFKDLSHLENDTDWEGVRNNLQFQKLKRKYTPNL